MEEVAVKKRGRPSKASVGGKSSTAAVAAISPGIKKRGRPAKNKGSSGGGGQRGRPPKASKIQNDEDPEDEGEEDGDGDGSGAELANNSSPSPTKGRGRPKSSGGAGSGSGDSVKTPGSAKKRKAGRPKKHQPSDSENEGEPMVVQLVRKSPTFHGLNSINGNLSTVCFHQTCTFIFTLPGDFFSKITGRVMISTFRTHAINHNQKYVNGR